mgnify:CR=1 FL=1
MTYIEVCFNINVLDSAEINSQMVREILVAELGVLNFERFVNNDDSLQAYVQEEAFDEQAVNDLYILHNPNFEIKIEVNCIEQQNWNAVWENSFEPIEVDGKCVVRAPFHDKKEVEFDIVITPKMSFGTGHHETTQLIIQFLLDIVKPGFKILDLGAGSGILSIAALKFGASYVKSIEYDQDCEENFLENMELNNIDSNYDLEINDVLINKDYDYDLIVANINKNIILDLLPNIHQYKKNKSKIILSGLLIDDELDLNKLLNQLKFKVIDKLKMGEWICLIIE